MTLATPPKMLNGKGKMVMKKMRTFALQQQPASLQRPHDGAKEAYMDSSTVEDEEGMSVAASTRACVTGLASQMKEC
ncbi:hypothetical protein E2542_SST08845 [Spatholobus suberectus]|nr:hypothetical protein E2542_SST08845 [Spatholobus suberectus]